MARKFKQAGDSVTYINAGSAIAAGAVVVMGDSVGVAAVDIAATPGQGVVDLEGVFEVPKTTGTAWVLGDKLDYDISAAEFHKGLSTAIGDIAGCAIAFAAAASGAATGLVKLQNPGTVDPS
jgi:predicted RecA/RadA family phage recombinase